ncbi:THAP domain-containing protein [Ooceraea biroi]|uniref:THAP domain-containing protein n=1 Tax=Ooceraea biroi TaxID=2015173 RepID=A0A026VUN8_OOCBI|nr:THAP domain-containing protein [Ooceraea biroi]
MLVALNDHWKVPVGYFLIDSLNGNERASLLEKCFELIYETGIILHSVTFDGVIVNLSMCTALGANFVVGENFKPYIINNMTKENIFCFFDPCHMLKLVRNTLGDKLELRHKGKSIYWQNIVLKKFQETEALQFCSQYVPERFKYPEETALFCSMFNDAFDILNVRSKFCKKKKCNMPLTNENYNKLKTYAGNIIEYIKQFKYYNHLITPDPLLFFTQHTKSQNIKQLQYSTNESILQSNRKTGFLGFIICLTNMFDLFHTLKEKGLKYLLTYKINQDHLETVFSALRSRAGFNDNPNAKQFESSYKRLLVRHEI